MLTKQTVKSMASLATVSCFLLLTQACATLAPARISGEKIVIPPGEIAIFLDKKTLELKSVIGDPGTGKLEKGKKCNFKGQGPKVCKGSEKTSLTQLRSLGVAKSNASPDCWFFYISAGGLVGWPPGCS